MKNASFIYGMVCLVFVFMIWGCGTQIGKKPVDVPGQRPAAEKKVDLLPILMAEAEKLTKEKQYQDALLVYNQALGQAESDSQRQEVIHALEQVLMQTPPDVLKEFSGIKNLSIPRALLLYWTGLNFAAGNDPISADQTLSAFLDDYPDHPYAPDARELIKDLKSSGFNRDTIGCVLPLSGKYEVYGNRALKGIQLAVQDMSENLGRPLKVIVKDTRSDPDYAVTCVEELAKENIIGIAGPLIAPEAAGQRAEELKIPMIALTQKKEFPLQGEFLFSNFITPEMQVQALGSYIFMELGLKRVAILYPDERYGRTYMELFWDVVDEFNGEVVGVEAYDGSSMDFTTPLQKLTGEYYPLPEFLIPPDPETEDPDTMLQNPEGGDRLADEAEAQGPKLSARGSAVANQDRLEIDFEALFIPDSLSRVNLILPQLAFNDARGMVLLGTNLWHQESLLTQARGYNKNAVITDGYFGQSTNPVTAGFHNRFQEIYQEVPGFLEAISYDTAAILYQAASHETVLSRTDVRDMLQGRQFFEGATGRTIFDKTGSPHKELFLITVKRGKFMEIRQ